jgi:DNA-binding transcriptional MerR regulator
MTPLPDVQLGSDDPLYNIGVVARMTGISMATLRAWERRYDFPEAERTAGGHRLYSEKDVTRLKWVKARIDEGMQTAQSINALRHQEQTGHFVMTDQSPFIRYEITPEGRDTDASASFLHKYQQKLLEVLAQRHISEADDILGEALALTSPEEIILKVVGPTFTQIGELWENGEVSVATEHLGTNYLRQRLLMWMLSGPPPRVAPPIMLACAPGEWHEGSLLILGSLLRRRRWPVAYLGQNVPLIDLANFIDEINPKLVVMVAMMEEAVEELINWPKLLPEVAQNGQPIMAYGGRAFVEKPEWRLKVQGIYLGNTFQEGIKTIEQLLQ